MSSLTQGAPGVDQSAHLPAGVDRAAWFNISIPEGEKDRGKYIYDTMVVRLRHYTHPETPKPLDADDPIWIVIHSAHGSEPRIDLVDGKLPETGSTRAEALQKALEFSATWDSSGGIANVVRLSDLTETNVRWSAMPEPAVPQPQSRSLNELITGTGMQVVASFRKWVTGRP